MNDRSLIIEPHRAVYLVVGLVLAVVLGLAVGASPGVGLAAVLGLAGVALAVSRPDAAVLALLAYFPFETWVLKYVPDGSYPLVVPDLMAAGLLLAVALRVAISGDVRIVSRRQIVWIAAALGAVSVVSALANPVPLIDEIYWMRVSLRFAPLGIVAAMDPWSGSIRKHLGTIAFPVALIQSLIGLLEYLGGLSVASIFWAGTSFTLGSIGSTVDTLRTVEDRVVAGTFSHYNIYALTLLLLMGVMISELVSDRVRDKYALVGGWFVVALSAGMIVLSQSRQNVIALGACMLVVAAITWATGGAKQRRAVAVGMLAMVILIAAAGASGRLGIVDRFGRLLQPGYWEVQLRSDRGYAVTAVAPAALAADPLLGAGPGAFHSSGSTGGQASGVARFGLDTFHSQFVGDVGWASFAAQVGLLGLVLVAALGALPLWGMRLARGPDSMLYAWTSAAFFVSMFGSTPLYYKPTSSVLWVIWGLATATIVGRARRAAVVPGN